MGKRKKVPAPTGGFFHSKNCNFPEESFILSSFCNSVKTIQEYNTGKHNPRIQLWEKQPKNTTPVKTEQEYNTGENRTRIQH